jgi:hypothetical protein
MKNETTGIDILIGEGEAGGDTEIDWEEIV